MLYSTAVSYYKDQNRPYYHDHLTAEETCDHQHQGQPSGRREANQNAAVYSGAAQIGHLYIHGLVCRVLQEWL